MQRPDDLRYLYENHEDFGALPSFLIIPGQIAFMTNGTDLLKIPGKTFDISQVHFFLFITDIFNLLFFLKLS